MTPKQRIDAVLAGQKPDRPAFSFWYHFAADQVAGPAAVQAHLDLLHAWHPDFLKVMNDNPYPHAGGVRKVEDLASLVSLRGDEEGFGRQLDLLADLRRDVHGQVYLVSTIFNAWMVLRLLVQPPTVHMPPEMDAAADGPSRRLREAYAARPELVTAAVQMIGQNLARFAGQCLRAGADGIFLSVRDDWVDVVPGGGLYRQLMRPADVQIMQAAAQARFNILHVCGKAVDFRALAGYPAVAAPSWADRAAGPSIAQVAGWLGPAMCCGVDNLGTLPRGTAADVRREVLDAIYQAGSRPMIVAPGCTFDSRQVPPANLAALVQAVGQTATETRP